MSRTLVPVDRQSDLVVGINQLIHRDLGNSGYGGKVRWTQYDGSDGTLILRNTAGIHRATLLAATSATATPSAANAVEQVTDSGLFIGAGKVLRLYATAGTNFGSLVSDANGGLTLGGTGSAAGDLTVADLTATSIAGLASLALTSFLSVGANPPDAGSVRLANNTSITARNAANSANIVLIQSTSGDVIQTGQAGTRHNLLGTVVAPAIDPPTVDGQVTAESQCQGSALFTVSGGAVALVNSYNVSGVAYLGVGVFRIDWNRDFANTSYRANVTASNATAAMAGIAVGGRAAASLTVVTWDAAGVLIDPTDVTVTAFGTLS